MSERFKRRVKDEDWTPWDEGVFKWQDEAIDEGNERPTRREFKQLSGTVSIADEGGNATVLEFQTAIQALYSSNNALPSYFDILTLLAQSNGAFAGRFVVVYNDDAAPGESTIPFTVSGNTYYALNISVTTAASLADAFDQYAGIFDQSGTSPRDDDIDPDPDGVVGAFALSVNGQYNQDTDPDTGVITLSPNNSCNIKANGGNIEPMAELDTTVSAKTDSFSFNLNGVTFVHAYVKYTIVFAGSQGSRVAQTIINPSIQFYKSDVDNSPEGGTFNSSGSEYTHYMHIGTVSLAARGYRRYAKINQTRSGDISGIQNFNSISTGTQTDSDGADVSDITKSGMREIILCVDGRPYSTFIMTGPLFEIT